MVIDFKRLALSLLIALLFLPTAALGVSVTPPTATVQYAPGEEIIVGINLRSNTPDESYAVLQVEDSLLSEYVSLESDSILLPQTGFIRTNIILNIPEVEGVYGRNAVRVLITEVPAEQYEGGISVRTGVRFRINIDFPYPGKYLEFNPRLTVTDINEGETASYEWGVISRGEEAVSFTSSISVFDSENRSVFTRSFSEESLQLQERHVESGVVSGSDSFAAGDYRAVVNVSFDNQSITSAASFRVGEEDVELISYSPEELGFDRINPFEFTISNKWKHAFNDVYGIIQIGGVSIRTPSDTLPGFGDQTFSHYIDTSRLDPGEYDASITVHFGGNQKEFVVPITVLSEAETLARMGEKPGWTTTQILITTLIVLVLLAFANVIFMLLRKNKK